MTTEKNEILKFSQYMKFDKTPYIIYVELQSLIQKIDGCKNSSATKISEHILCGYSMSAIWGFDHIENKHISYHGKDCMRKFYNSLREHLKKLILKRKKILPLTKEELKSNQYAKEC